MCGEFFKNLLHLRGVTNAGDTVPISNITLGLFADTGWYTVNYGVTGDLIMGKGRGCSFASVTVSICYKHLFLILLRYNLSLLQLAYMFSSETRENSDLDRREIEIYSTFLFSGCMSPAYWWNTRQ